ncbi:MAG: hypothetical protein FJZ01_20905 [Candidatus Sericytochromatia bacterium]|nr:hypothetical protein [Candidatus Tanganyikabacteria bacterium]
MIETLNRMAQEGVIDTYAIGGAVGATFFLEPIATQDIDVFVAFRPEPGRTLVSLEPVYRYLIAQGATTEGEYLIIDDWPVQFLPATDALAEDALAQAMPIEVEGAPTKVFRAEHLAALALQTGRAKDKARVLAFLEAEVMDFEMFEAIVERFGLREKWDRFKLQFEVEG